MITFKSIDGHDFNEVSSPNFASNNKTNLSELIKIYPPPEMFRKPVVFFEVIEVN